MRLQLGRPGGIRVLDDAYNANADSMLAALQTLCNLQYAGRRVAVLGDMAELGESSQAAHAEVGGRAAEFRLAGYRRRQAGRGNRNRASAAVCRPWSRFQKWKRPSAPSGNLPGPATWC